MTTMGVWHGLTWYYIAYGIYHATLLILNDVFDRWHAKHPLAIDKYKKLSTAISIAITFNLVCFGLLLFSGRLAGSSNIPATK
jgi:membrane protein involved in D-alanine export